MDASSVRAGFAAVRGERRLHFLSSIVAGLAKVLAGATVRWLGCRPDAKQRIYFSNHTSHLDFVLIWSALPRDLRVSTRPVAAEDYWERGPIRRYLAREVFRAVLVERRDPSGDRHAAVGAAASGLRAILAALEKNDSLIVFPEGTRSTTGRVEAFKPGLYHIVLHRPNVELVPVYVENLNRILPKGEFLPVPLLSRVVFGPPVKLEEGEPKRAFLERARESVVRLATL